MLRKALAWILRNEGRGKTPVGLVELRIPKTRFLHEQTGPIETQLKARLADALAATDLVQRAYLVRVAYDEQGTYDVALCIRTASGQVEEKLLPVVRATFASLFGSDMHLDILFVDDARETELAVVCGPFYQARGGALG
jgi:hypothetical protein